MSAEIEIHSLPENERRFMVIEDNNNNSTNKIQAITQELLTNTTNFDNLDEKGKKKTSKTHIDYYQNFKDKHKDNINMKVCCDICGGSYSYYNKSGHLKTKKCITVKNLRNL